MQKRLTIGILAHVDAGKTTLSEGLLYLSGALRKLGRVDHRDTFLDTYELERTRGITIFSKQALFEYEDTHFTLLDTPGHSDFSPEMERTLQVLDAAILLISASDKVTAQAKILWKLLSHYHVPTFIFVNKMDQDGADKALLLKDIRENLSSHCIAFEDGFDSDELQEELAVCDDKLLTAFLDGQKVTEGDVKSLIADCKCYPVLFGSALKMDGVKELLSFIKDFAPDNKYDENAPFAARVFKISRDVNGNRLTHIKITSGKIKVRDLIDDEKIDQIRLYSGEKFEMVQEAAAGTVCAIAGLCDSKAGDGLGELKNDTTAEILQPILSSTLILPEDADPVVVYRKLKALEEEEPMLQVSLKEGSGIIEVKIMGEVQKEILKHLIKTRFDLDVDFGPGHIVYKETIAGPVEGVGHFEPLRHYAEVHILLEPSEPGSGMSFACDVSTDDLSLNWQRLILTHLQEKKHLGVLTGSELTDVKITLIGGRSHEKHTEGGDFRQATYRAVRQGLMEADSILLEPVYEYRIELPKESVGRALTDIQRMHGTVGLPDIVGDKNILTGTIPAASLGSYAQELSSFTHGEGHITTTLKGYQPCHNTEEVLAETGYDPDLDTGNPSSSVFCSHGVGTIIPWNEVRSHMHVDTGWSPETADTYKTDLTDNIDMEALKKIQARQKSKAPENRSFDEIERDLQATEKELKNIFEKTYGEIKPRYVEKNTTYTSSNEADKPEIDNRDYALEEAKKEKHQNTGSVDDSVHKEYLLVDGYNVIYASDDLKSLAQRDLKAARDSLIDTLINFQGFRREQVILVFDAYKVPGGTEHMEDHSGLIVIYTKEAETADQYIEKAAHEIGKKYKVTVATSDAIEQVIVLSSGAFRLSARDFWDEIKRTSEMISDKIRNHNTKL